MSAHGVICGSCLTPSAASARFCNQCGSPLTDSAVPLQRTVQELLVHINESPQSIKLTTFKQLYRRIAHEDGAAKAARSADGEATLLAAIKVQHDKFNALYIYGALAELKSELSDEERLALRGSIREPTQADLDKILKLLRAADSTERDEETGAELTGFLAQLHPQYQSALWETGIITEVIRIVQSSAHGPRGAAAVALAAVTDTARVIAATGDTNIVSCLMEITYDGAPKHKECAAFMMNVFTDYEGEIEPHMIYSIPMLIDLLNSSRAKSHEYAAAVLANVSKDAKIRAEIGSSGGVVLLVRLLESGTPRQQDHALRAIARLTLDLLNAMMAIQAGGIPVLEKLLSDSSEQRQIHALWALGRLADAKHQIKSLEVASPTTTDIVRKLQLSSNASVKDAATFALTHLEV